MARSAPLLLLAAWLTGIGMTLTTSCGTELTQEASRSWTSTVTLGQQTILEIHAPLPLVIEGLPRTNDLVLEVNAVATASSATTAQQLVDALDFQFETEGRRLRLTGEGFKPTNGRIGGALFVRLPDDMELDVFGSGGPVEIFDMEGGTRVNAVTHTRITRASGNVFVRVDQGNALVETTLDRATSIDVLVAAGDVQLTLPRAVSAQIGAETLEGTILVRHPGLPRPVQGLAYRTTVGGGLSVVALGTRRGNILIQSGL